MARKKKQKEVSLEEVKPVEIEPVEPDPKRYKLTSTVSVMEQRRFNVRVSRDEDALNQFIKVNKIEPKVVIKTVHYEPVKDKLITEFMIEGK